MSDFDQVIISEEWESTDVSLLETLDHVLNRGLVIAGEITISVADIDLIFVGPGDLSVSIDAVGPAGTDRLNEAIRTIIGATVVHGRTAGIFCPSPQTISRWAASGASFFVLASDTMFLGAGAAANNAAARAELG